MEHRGWAAGSWTGSWLALPLDFCGTLLTVWIRALLPPPPPPVLLALGEELGQGSISLLAQGLALCSLYLRAKSGS